MPGVRKNTSPREIMRWGGGREWPFGGDSKNKDKELKAFLTRSFSSPSLCLLSLAIIAVKKDNKINKNNVKHKQ